MNLLNLTARVAPETTRDFDKEAIHHMSESPRQVCLHASRTRSRLRGEHSSDLCSCADSSAGWSAPSHSPCSPAVWREKRVRLERRRSFSSVLHTFPARAPLAGATHTNFIRQMRAGAPSERPLPGSCDLHCLTTFRRSHETATGRVLPAAAWVRRDHQI